MIAPNKDFAKPETFDVRVQRQSAPGKPAKWERFRVPYEPNMNVISVLQKIARMSKTASGERTTPVAWDCNCLEEICGSCTMVINGRVRQSCSALVDQLLEDKPGEIELRPMSKFPVVRDLVVDRQRMFRALERVDAWVPVDDYLDRGPGPKESQDDQEERYPLSQCMTCGCCLEACPQYTKIELERKPGETDDAFEVRQQAAYDSSFLGAQAISQAVLFNDHGTGKMLSDERTEALMGPGGVHACGNSQNCVAVCPKEIPLTTSIAQAGRQVTVYSIKKFFDR
ncbi:MAG: succinate dehydrogenase iron-sulfur subunit [Planctomycetota bacterium]